MGELYLVSFENRMRGDEEAAVHTHTFVSQVQNFVHLLLIILNAYFQIVLSVIITIRVTLNMLMK
jgi:hypothetical protein